MCWTHERNSSFGRHDRDALAQMSEKAKAWNTREPDANIPDVQIWKPQEELELTTQIWTGGRRKLAPKWSESGKPHLLIEWKA